MEQHSLADAHAATPLVRSRAGDTAVLEEGGYYRLLGRTSVDVIKHGGFKVGPLTPAVALPPSPLRCAACEGEVLSDVLWRHLAARRAGASMEERRCVRRGVLPAHSKSSHCASTCLPTHQSTPCHCRHPCHRSLRCTLRACCWSTRRLQRWQSWACLTRCMERWAGGEGGAEA